jgi:F-type H+-transporting ATPase subunit b
VLPILSASDLIKPDPGLMWWTLITFVVVMLILRRYAFGPIQAALDARRNAIESDIDAAEKAREEAQAALAEYRAALAESRKEAAKLMDDARRQIETRRAADLAELEADKARHLERARAEIAAETRQALAQIKAQVAELTMAATEKVVRARLDEAEQRRLIDDALAGLDFDALAPREPEPA